MNKDFTRIQPEEVDWRLIYDVVCESGKSHNPRSFAMDLLAHIGRICPFDAGVVFFLDQNGKIVGSEQYNASPHYHQIYEAYRARVEMDPRIYQKEVNEDPAVPTINVHDWEKEWLSNANISFVHPATLKYSCGFALYDLRGQYTSFFSLDRHTGSMFSNRELYSLQVALRQLNQLHKNFYYRESQLDTMEQTFWNQADLTAREIEVVDLLLQGVTPQNISKILYISMSTTYKHINHIYAKMNVGNRQELMVKLLAVQRGETIR